MVPEMFWVPGKKKRGKENNEEGEKRGGEEEKGRKREGEKKKGKERESTREDLKTKPRIKGSERKKIK